MITVAIPVGPNAGNTRYLADAIASVISQEDTSIFTEILLIDDQAHLAESHLYQKVASVRIWETPWLVGVAHAFNFGVALAKNDLVLMLGSDDILYDQAATILKAAWEKQRDPLGYYYMAVEYMDTGEQQTLACNAAMVHKELWRNTGGFRIETAVGAPDAAFISSLMVNHDMGKLFPVDSSTPQYLYRRHPETDTLKRAAPFLGAIGTVRGIVTDLAKSWERPSWTR